MTYYRHILLVISRPTQSKFIIAVEFRCNRPEYTPGQNIPGVKAA